jgi:2-dehydropantoate 2-reductase
VTRVVVAGAGALGSVVGGLLARSGEDVVLLAHGAHADALRGGPLTLRLPAETVQLEVTVADRAGGDVIVLASKRFDSAAALDRVEGTAQLAVSLQNGLSKNDELVERFGAGRVVGATTTIAARIAEPGIVECGSLGLTYLGTAGEGAAAFAAALQASGMPTIAADDATAVEWSKLAHVAGVMLLQALTRLRLHALFGDPDGAVLLRLLIAEVGTVATASGSGLLDLDGLLPVATLAAGSDEAAVAALAARSEALARMGATNLRSSLLTSIEQGRRTELEAIHGELVARAASLGVPVPTLATCYRLARLTTSAFPS